MTVTTKSMTVIDVFAKELEQEALITRKMLARVPTDKFDWQPHEKSMSMIRLATHIAELPTWIGMTLLTDELDFASNPYSPAKISTNAELLDYFERSLADGRACMADAREEQLMDLWTLREAEQVYSTSAKVDVLRMTFSQIIHHRAQLGVYLRLLNIPIPGSYGPSADDLSF